MCEHGCRSEIDCDICRPRSAACQQMEAVTHAVVDRKRVSEKVPLKPDWKLPPRDELAIAIRISLSRRGIGWGDVLATEEQWAEMADEIIETLERD